MFSLEALEWHLSCPGTSLSDVGCLSGCTIAREEVAKEVKLEAGFTQWDQREFEEKLEEQEVLTFHFPVNWTCAGFRDAPGLCTPLLTRY